MKKLLLLVFVFLQGLFAQAQTMQDIIARHVAAMGGREKIMKLSSVGMSGSFRATGDTADIPLSVNKKHMVGSRMDIIANNTSNYQLVTPQNGWLFTPVQGDTAPRPLMPDLLKSLQAQLDLHGPFINSSEKGYKIEMAGRETMDGILCYNLKVTAPNGNVTVYAISSQTYFIVKTSTKMQQFGGLEDVATSYGNYKQNEDGFWFPYTNITYKGKTHFDTIKTNVPVNTELFKLK